MDLYSAHIYNTLMIFIICSILLLLLVLHFQYVLMHVFCGILLVFFHDFLSWHFLS